ncbi:MAG: hypothetical protein JWL86_6163 [Rhizobium sp.]|nr:hypothetical protein [Rhizobium sp.]
MERMEGKTSAILRKRPNVVKHDERLFGQRHVVWSAHLHTLGWNAPDGLLQVEFVAGSATNFSRPHAGESEELERGFQGWPTVVVIDSLEELAEFALVGNGGAARDLRRFQCAFEGGRRVILGT